MNVRSCATLALVALTLAACGQQPTAPVAVAASQAESAPSIMANGVKHKLDYDWNRYKKVHAPRANPKKMPRQGLLPTKVDNRKLCPAVYNQGELGSCTAFAVGKGLRETLAKQGDQKHTELSALFLYYETRVRLGGFNKLVDSGGTITDAVAVLKSKGVAPESAWSYDFMQFIRFRVKPPKTAYEQAKAWKVKETQQLGFLDDVKTALSQGKTVAFGFEVFESFERVKSNGLMPVPKPGEKIMGGHAVLAVGYDDAKNRLIVRNSWGDGWGDKGYFYMPYEFITPERADDFWTAE